MILGFLILFLFGHLLWHTDKVAHTTFLSMVQIKQTFSKTLTLAKQLLWVVFHFPNVEKQDPPALHPHNKGCNTSMCVCLHVPAIHSDLLTLITLHYIVLS